MSKAKNAKTNRILMTGETYYNNLGKIRPCTIVVSLRGSYGTIPSTPKGPARGLPIVTAVRFSAHGETPIGESSYTEWGKVQ